VRTRPGRPGYRGVAKRIAEGLDRLRERLAYRGVVL